MIRELGFNKFFFHSYYSKLKIGYLILLERTAAALKSSLILASLWAFPPGVFRTVLTAVQHSHTMGICFHLSHL